MRHIISIFLVVGVLGISPNRASAKSQVEEEVCVREQAEAVTAYVQCLSAARINGIWGHLSNEQLALLSLECEAAMLEQTEARSLTFEGQCDTAADHAVVTDWSSAEGHGLTEMVKPKIPKRNFEWKGTFIGNPLELDDPQIETTVTIRGKWQGRYFNVYMEQGYKGSGIWVENVLYRNKLYTITHEWHTRLPDFLLGSCFENTVYNPGKPLRPLPITIDDLNGILESSRLVGLEIIDGKPMSHFRATCLSKAGIPDFPWVAPLFTVNIFSDIYVPPGRAYPWYRWLQFGDGVGPDPQNDEWFYFDEWSREPADIVLPKECRRAKSVKVQQAPCSNLVEQLDE